MGLRLVAVGVAMLLAPLCACNPNGGSAAPPATTTMRFCGAPVAVPANAVSEKRAQAVATGESQDVSSGVPVHFVSVCVGRLVDVLPGVGSGVAPLEAPVWNFRYSGSFGAPSCGSATTSPGACPRPAQHEQQVIIDMKGNFLEMGTPPEIAGVTTATP